ncbi:hypothetical protein Ancab_023126 [Ancistrocladus abbreviatus]
MATTVREGTIGKEKKGISPSHPSTKKTTKLVSPSSSDHKTNLSSPEKPVPNYLKPTISSCRDSSSLAKRPSTDSSVQRPALDRRRSFDKPPSPARLQKALRGTTPTSFQEKPTRSTSFTNSRTPPHSSRPIERLSKTPAKDAKIGSSSPLVKPRTTGRSNTPGTKKDGNMKISSSTKTALKSATRPTPESSVDAHNEDLRLDHVISDDEAEHVDHEVQSLPDISEMPGHIEHLGDPDIEIEPRNAKQEKAKAEEDKEEEKHNICKGSDPVDKVAKEETHEKQEHDDHVWEENIAKHPQEIIAETADYHSQLEAEDKETEENIAAAEENGINEEVITEEEGKEELVDKEKKEEESGLEVIKQGGEEMENAVEEPEPEAQNVTAVDEQQQQQQQSASAGKKEAQAYNDVIEETASKLMENRKNKVRALAGAFETVISLQETK